MNIVFMGAKQGGMIGLLTVCSWWDYPDFVIAYDDILLKLAKELELEVVDSIKNIFKDVDDDFDLLISIHGREIVPNDILERFKYGGINLHPMLSKYKGMNPITRFIFDNEKGETDNVASVGCHVMTDELDGGEILSEKFITIENPWEKSPVEIYNELYPLYPLVLMEAIQKVCG